MILDEKILMYPPPPPYVTSAGPPPFPGSSRGPRPTLATLPSHILLQIVYRTFPQTSGVNEGKVERQRKTLLWLVGSLRFVNRAFYIACMNVLRSTYLPAYQSLIRPPYTSDPFPISSSPISSASSSSTAPPSPSVPSYTPTPLLASPLQTLQRETPILDRFIALKVREDVFADDSELHLEREDMFKDLFDLSQPKARLEDLVRVYGVREGVVSVPGGLSGSSSRARLSPSTSKNASTTTLTPRSPNIPAPPSPNTLSTRASAFFSSLKSSSSSSKSSLKPHPLPPPQPPAPKITPLPFSRLSVSFSPRRVGLVLSSSGQGQRRTIVEVQRSRDERLEVAARRVVGELRVWLAE